MGEELAISLKNVSKCFKRYARPVDRLKEILVPGKSYAQEFWALRDVSFDVNKAETMGIIGRNGAGKSTLLQMICGTLTPTNGEVQVNGRVAALLELGAGFNPEFTGRENVYMNGAIMGLSRQDVDERFDKVAAFADIGDFIEQPVKSYSSGMYVRLAFASAIHVDPDILIVDEALSVGDMFFQAKCMTRMKQMMDTGVTVLFVSHDVGAVKSLCRQAILLSHGELITSGSANQVVEKYFSMKVESEQVILKQDKLKNDSIDSELLVQSDEHSFVNNLDFLKRAAFQRIQNGKASFINVQILNEEGKKISNLDYGQNLILRMHIEIYEDIEELVFGYHIRDKNGADIVYSDSEIEDKTLKSVKQGERYIIDWKFKATLIQGIYNISCVLSIPIQFEIAVVDFCDFVPLAVQFGVAPRKDARLYGSVHLDNCLEILKY
ncbi:ABC transporter ATP-binding protein [Nostoc sp. 'Peltigera membranacea cyanobiont' 210A]|uniref:ABC transporter ATP-binding protein n=1 Tax=Nostoc sp. 'Peltigera membranacea cyanobiont' 210A TaxID=2014529 RepID=UPI000B950AC2|nr:ABC transporter ATP-binding protein [Nostoc sp. 'Peltigera membranacea cyanobiont' 210A]OYD91098.1 ABC transporter ATP-binding protein [Nostoc sp. 'Peltigera membranacea cyanobiont' 210A]